MRKLERIARGICQNASHEDPDQLAYPPMQHRWASGKPHILLVPKSADPDFDLFYTPRPLWNWYLDDARAALNAMTGMYVTGQWDARLREILNEPEEPEA